MIEASPIRHKNYETLAMKIALTLALLFACFRAFAQDMPDGTVDVYYQPQSADGQLNSCMLVFTSLVRDHATMKGAQVIVNGSIAIRKIGAERLMFTGKLGTRPFSAQNQWQAPAHFFFATANRSTAGLAKIADAESPGYKLLIAPMGDEIIQFLEEMGRSGEFTVGFNRKAGGQDVRVPVKIAVSLTKDVNGSAVKVDNEKTRVDFYACLSKLLK